MIDMIRFCLVHITVDYCYDQVITALVTTYDITPILHLKILIRVRKLFLQSTIINIGNKRIQNISHIIAGLKSILNRYRLDIIRGLICM